jgi:hypothetical protein
MTADGLVSVGGGRRAIVDRRASTRTPAILFAGRVVRWVLYGPAHGSSRVRSRLTLMTVRTAVGRLRLRDAVLLFGPAWILKLVLLVSRVRHRGYNYDEDDVVEDCTLSFYGEEEADEFGRWFDDLSRDEQKEFIEGVQTDTRRERRRESHESIIHYVRGRRHRFVTSVVRPRSDSRRRPRGRAARSRRARAPSRSRQDDTDPHHDVALRGCR